MSEQPQKPQVQMDPADARLLEMLRLQEQDAVRRVELARKETMLASRDVQDFRTAFHNAIKEMSDKYGQDLTFFEIDPISGKGQMTAQALRQQQFQKNMLENMKKSPKQGVEKDNVKANNQQGKSLGAETEKTEAETSANG